MVAKDARADTKNTLFVLPFVFSAKEKGRFFEAGAANPCQLWLEVL